MQKVICASLSLFIAFNLVACTDVAMTGAQVVYNRRNIANNLTDQYNAMRVYQALYMKTDEFKNTNIAISVYNDDLLLAGQVPEPWQRTKAEKIARQAADVSDVYNLLTIASPSSQLTRISDAWITTKVKTNLLASGDVDASKIKVVTENGTVYLMGIILPDEANAAAEIASTTDGVQEVVKVFSYIYISKKLRG